MTLTVREKEHWKETIERKVKRAIAELYAQGEHNLLIRIDKDAKRKALESLGILEWQERLDDIASTISKLMKEQEDVRASINDKLSVVRSDSNSLYFYQYSLEGIVSAQRKRFHRELLAQEPLGRMVQHLESELEQLLDAVWLATSSKQINEIWSRVSKLLEQPPTSFQREALEISAEPTP